MHPMIYIPAGVFCAVAAACWLVSAVIDRRAAAAGRRLPAAIMVARPVFRPIVIDGGLKTSAANLAHLRPAQSRLRFAGAAPAARSA